MMWVPMQQTSALRGGSIRLRCVVEAHPEALVFWEHGGRMMQNGRRVRTETKQGAPTYKVSFRTFRGKIWEASCFFIN